MAKQLHKLTALGVAKLKLGISKETGERRKRARFSDGGNLFFAIGENGSRTWSFIYRGGDGRTHEIGLGAYPDVSLKEARAKAEEKRAMLRDGIDPLAAKRESEKPKKEASSSTFGEAMEGFLAVKGHEWRNQKNIAQIRSLMRTHCEKIADIPADQITTKHVLEIVKPLFFKAPIQGQRLLRLVESTLDAAYALDDTGDRRANPARWRKHMDKLLPKRKSTSVKHHAAMPYQKLPAFIGEVRDLRGDVSTGAINTAAFALEFLILTAARSAEVLGARWSEIDLEKGVWCLPPGRMKSHRPHSVPLSSAAISLLAAMPRVEDSAFIFVGRGPIRKKGERRRPPKTPQPTSNKTLGRLLERMKRTTVTVHGFRSSFRDWAGNETAFAREIAEMALSHVVGDASERSYRRGDALARRRELMDAWAAYLDPAAGGNVLKFPQRA